VVQWGTERAGGCGGVSYAWRRACGTGQASRGGENK
jgi:hypothetical protein